MTAHPAVDDDVGPAIRTPKTESAAVAAALAANVVQRILLVTDGTVTNVVEAYAGEPISVVKLRQATEPAACSGVALEVPESEPMLYREVLLQGTKSGRIFVHARSQIVPGRLDAAVRRGLIESVKPIGRLLEENRVETFREVLWARREPAGARGIHLGINPAALVVSRTYRIVAGGRPMMLITEKFSVDAFGR